jgi:hypothetical protein
VFDADVVRVLIDRGADPETTGLTEKRRSTRVVAARAEEKNPFVQQALDAVASVLRTGRPNMKLGAGAAAGIAF